MGIPIDPEAQDHPARRAAHRSMAAAMAGDREGWLACFAPTAVVEDPVGPSPLDPAGDGHRGLDAIRAFWDETIAPMGLRFEIRDSFACGPEVANVGTIHLTTADGAQGRTDGVFTYRVDEDGRVTSLRAHWELERTMASFTSPDSA